MTLPLPFSDLKINHLPVPYPSRFTVADYISLATHHAAVLPSSISHHSSKSDTNSAPLREHAFAHRQSIHPSNTMSPEQILPDLGCSPPTTLPHTLIIELQSTYITPYPQSMPMGVCSTRRQHPIPTYSIYAIITKSPQPSITPPNTIIRP